MQLLPVASHLTLREWEHAAIACCVSPDLKGVAGFLPHAHQLRPAELDPKEVGTRSCCLLRHPDPKGLDTPALAAIDTEQVPEAVGVYHAVHEVRVQLGDARVAVQVA
eukprot:4054774-Pyramimonas_sp.AAC.1